MSEEYWIEQGEKREKEDTEEFSLQNLFSQNVDISTAPQQPHFRISLIPSEAFKVLSKIVYKEHL